MQVKRTFLTITVLFTLLLPNLGQTQQQERPIVRLIYFLPSDRQPQPDIDEKMDTLIKGVQQFYAEQMEAHGFDKKTFLFEADRNGNAVVHHVVGQFTDKYYTDLPNTSDIWGEIGKQFDISKNIYLTAIDISSEALSSVGSGVCGLGTHSGSAAGNALMPASGECFGVWPCPAVPRTRTHFWIEPRFPRNW